MRWMEVALAYPSDPGYIELQDQADKRRAALVKAEAALLKRGMRMLREKGGA